MGTLSYWDVTADAWYSEWNSTQNLGNGLGSRLQSGLSSAGDYKNRFGIGWLKPASVPNGATIIAATAFLKVRGNPGGACFGNGGTPKLLVERVADVTYVPVEISAGSGECALDSGSGTGRYPGPSTTGTGNKAFWEGTPSVGDVISIDLTNQFKDWWAARASGDTCYAAVFKPSNAAGTAEEQISGRRIAFHAADGTTAIFDGGNGSYLLVEYSVANAPSAPTLNTPANGARVTQPGATRTLSFTYVHPDGDAGTDYNIVVATSNHVTGGALDTGLVVNKTVTAPLVNGNSYGPVLDTVADFTPDEIRGSTYYWQIRCRANAIWGVFSGVRSYSVNRLPLVTVTSPP
jgi:hypothetical protein